MRRSGGPARREVSASIGLHLLVGVIVWATTAFRAAPIEYETIQIQLVSPPPARAETAAPQPAPEEELVVETPEPEPDAPPPPDPQEEVTPPPEPERTPDPQPEPEPEQQEPEPAGDPEAVDVSADPGENLNVNLEGLQRDYPEYYGHIIRQIQRCFRSIAGSHFVRLSFVIHSDGTVSDIQTVESSGNLAFEIRATQAIECAGGGRFGPLPEDLPYDRLPVEFFFRPGG